LVERNKEIEIINYKRSAQNYLVFDWLEVINNFVDSNVFKHKIVLVGVIDKTGFNIEDKHYTPLNQDFLHKRVPDMEGVIIHANILSMIINDDFIKRVPGWLNVLIAVLLTYIHIAVFINYYVNASKWFHIRFKAIQLLSSVLFIYLGIRLLRWEVYFDFTLLLTAVILSVDVLYFYEGFANWLEKKFGYLTVFRHSKH
jgi:CHASE2 domain-containing sensor protein